MSGLLAAMTTFVAGVLLGAAIQRWGDRDRATHGHRDYQRVTLGRTVRRPMVTLDEVHFS